MVVPDAVQGVLGGGITSLSLAMFHLRCRQKQYSVRVS